MKKVKRLIFGILFIPCLLLDITAGIMLYNFPKYVITGDWGPPFLSYHLSEILEIEF